MASFPILNSGAVTQYPSLLGTGQAVQVIRFLDGEEQRFINQGRQFRRWQVNLRQLTDREMFGLQIFFEGQLGDYSTFSFPDPISGKEVLNCRLGDPEFTVEFGDINSSAASFWVIETNG